MGGRLPAREQPGRGSRVADGGVTMADGEDLPGQGVEGVGEYDGLVAEAQSYLVADGLDVIEGEAADRRRCLGVEEDEQARRTPGLRGVVVDQTAGLLPAGLGVGHPGWPAPADGCEVQSGELVALGPADEVSRVGAVACLRGGQPCVEVALAGCGQSEAAGGEPVEQADGGLDDPLGADDLAVGGVSIVQSAGHVPGA